MNLSATPAELAEKAFALVRSLAVELAGHDPRLVVVARAMWQNEIAQSEAKLTFQGFSIVIENPAGTVREWTDPASGEKGSTTMLYAYGYIDGTKGADGDEYDCFIGPDPTASMVYVIDQNRITDRQPDEQKAMIGFTTPNEALQAYIAHYDDPNFLGSINAMPLEEFRAKVYQTTEPNADGMVKSMTVEAPPAVQLVFIAPEPPPVAEPLERGLDPTSIAPMMTADANAVFGGNGGLMIAVDSPPQPSNATDISFTRQALEQIAQAKHEPVRRDRDTYAWHTPTRGSRTTDDYLRAVPAPVPVPAEATRARLAEMADFRGQASEHARPYFEHTFEKSELGPCTLRVHANGSFDVQTPKASDFQAFPSLTAACDHVWVLQKGFASVEAWWEQNKAARRVPSGAGWKFWGLKKAPPQPSDAVQETA